MACYNVPHLVRRGGVYRFRMAVPHALVVQFGRREIKGSLKTADPFTARSVLSVLAREKCPDGWETVKDYQQKGPGYPIWTWEIACLK